MFRKLFYLTTFLVILSFNKNCLACNLNLSVNKIELSDDLFNLDSIETTNLILKNMSDDDINDLHKILTHYSEEKIENLNFNVVENVNISNRFKELVISDYNFDLSNYSRECEQSLSKVIRSKSKNSDIIGNVMIDFYFKKFDEETANKVAVISLFIDEPFVNKNFEFEVLELLTEKLINCYDVNSVVICCLTDNEILKNCIFKVLSNAVINNNNLKMNLGSVCSVKNKKMFQFMLYKNLRCFT